MKNTSAKSNKPLKPYILIQCYKNTITIGKDVIRLLNFPEYICFSVNDTNGSILMFPCDENNVMSFKVPESLFTNSSCSFRITSKAFVCDIMRKYNLSIEEVYSYNGILVAENTMLFSLTPDNQHILNAQHNTRDDEKISQ